LAEVTAECLKRYGLDKLVRDISELCLLLLIYIRFWDYVWTMLAIVIALLVFSQLVSHTLEEHMQGFVVLPISSILLQKQVLFYFYLLATLIYIVWLDIFIIFLQETQAQEINNSHSI
jgi:hypothetical protein